MSATYTFTPGRCGEPGCPCESVAPELQEEADRIAGIHAYYANMTPENFAIVAAKVAAIEELLRAFGGLVASITHGGVERFDACRFMETHR